MKIIFGRIVDEWSYECGLEEVNELGETGAEAYTRGQREHSGYVQCMGATRVYMDLLYHRYVYKNI